MVITTTAAVSMVLGDTQEIAAKREATKRSTLESGVESWHKPEQGIAVDEIMIGLEVGQVDSSG